MTEIDVSFEAVLRTSDAEGWLDLREDRMMTSPEKVTGPRSYFPSIEKTYGRPVGEWQAIVRTTPGYGAGAKHMDLVKVLKDEHGMGHGHANAVVAETLREDRM